jgi:hypothetical protein
MLEKEQFELIWAQMDYEEEGKITIEDVSNVMDMPKFKGHTSMSKHFMDFETYLSQHYGIEGFKLN